MLKTAPGNEASAAALDATSSPSWDEAATGREVDLVVMHMDRTVGDRLVEHRGIGDINTLRAPLGAAPATLS